MSKRKRKPGDSTRRRSDQFKTRRAPVFMLTDCPGCRLCDLLGRSSSIPVSSRLVGHDGSPYSEEPGADHAGSLFDQTPDSARSDLPWKV